MQPHAQGPRPTRNWCCKYGCEGIQMGRPISSVRLQALRIVIVAEAEGPRPSKHQPRARLYVRAMIYHLGRGSKVGSGVICQMVVIEGRPADRRLVIRSTSIEPWPTPEGSTSSHNVERRRYKLLQPLPLLRSDNCISEQNFSSMPVIATPVSEFPHRLAGYHSRRACPYFWGLEGGPQPRDAMHGCVGVARHRGPKAPSAQVRRLWSPGTCSCQTIHAALVLMLT